MASWGSLVTYVTGHYKIIEQTDRMIQMGFNLPDMRSQIVFLFRQHLVNVGEEWVQIESPFAEIGSVDLVEVVREVSDTVCGGLSAVGDYLTIRHAAPLAHLDVNELERPLLLVTHTADALEQKFSGRDAF
jgi:hypothetical protein